MTARLATSTGTIARLPPRSSADRYAASFQPPYVSSTNTMARPNRPAGGVLTNSPPCVTGVEAVDATTRAAATTATSPATSTIVNQFCVRADARRPAILTVVSATTTTAAQIA